MSYYFHSIKCKKCHSELETRWKLHFRIGFQLLYVLHKIWNYSLLNIFWFVHNSSALWEWNSGVCAWFAIKIKVSSLQIAFSILFHILNCAITMSECTSLTVITNMCQFEYTHSLFHISFNGVHEVWSSVFDRHIQMFVCRELVSYAVCTYVTIFLVSN